jgi:hypothetical protein
LDIFPEIATYCGYSNNNGWDKDNNTQILREPTHTWLCQNVCVDMAVILIVSRLYTQAEIQLNLPIEQWLIGRNELGLNGFYLRSGCTFCGFTKQMIPEHPATWNVSDNSITPGRRHITGYYLKNSKTEGLNINWLGNLIHSFFYMYTSPQVLPNKKKLLLAFSREQQNANGLESRDLVDNDSVALPKQYVSNPTFGTPGYIPYTMRILTGFERLERGTQLKPMAIQAICQHVRNGGLAFFQFKNFAVREEDIRHSNFCCGVDRNADILSLFSPAPTRRISMVWCFSHDIQSYTSATGTHWELVNFALVSYRYIGQTGGQTGPVFGGWSGEVDFTLSRNRR